MAATAKKEITLPSVERAGPEFVSGAGWYVIRAPFGPAVDWLTTAVRRHPRLGRE
jgi:hypothetical protein